MQDAETKALNLAMMLRRMIYMTEKYNGGNVYLMPLVERACDLLKRYDLQGNPLRNDAAEQI